MKQTKQTKQHGLGTIGPTKGKTMKQAKRDSYGLINERIKYVTEEILKIYLMFYMPTVTIDADTGQLIEIQYKWTDKNAEMLHNNLTEILEFLQQQIRAQSHPIPPVSPPPSSLLQ